jgi:hypothetical protein
MAAVRCSRCGATVTAQLAEGRLATTHGEAFSSKCKSRDAAAKSASAMPEDCADMRKALDRVRRLSGAAAGADEATA